MTTDSVTIEGSTMPAAGVLRRGEQATVAFTPRITRLANGGFVKILAVHGTPITDGSVPEQADTAEPEDDLDEGLDDVTTEAQAPNRNASKSEWLLFFRDNDLIAPEGASRDDLVAEWDRLQADGA